MFNFGLYTIPANCRPVWLAVGATLVAILAAQTLTVTSAYEQSSLPVRDTLLQQSGGIPDLVPAWDPSSPLLSNGQPTARYLVTAEHGKRSDLREENVPSPSFGSGVDYSGPLGAFTVGRGGNETTGEPATPLTARQSQKAPGGPPSTEFAPLLDADNLVRVFNYRNSTKDWLFFDPRPAFAGANTLLDIRSREIYWVKVNRDQDVTLNGKQQRVSCQNEGTAYENCWNLLVW